MAFFCITDKQHDITLGKFASLDTALMSAINESRLLGERSVQVFFEGYTALIKSGNGQTEMFTVQPIPSGGRPGPKPRKQTEPLSKSVIKFVGKPPKDGWYSALAGGELLLNSTSMTVALDAAKHGDYVAVFSDAEGNALSTWNLGNFRATADKLLASASKGATLDLSKFAKEEAGCITNDVNAAAMFLLLAHKPRTSGFTKKAVAAPYFKFIAKRKEDA